LGEKLISSKNKIPLLFLAPLPPPYAGVESVMEELLNSPLQEYFEIHHVDISVSKKNVDKGKIKISAIFALLLISLRICYYKFKYSARKAYFPLSSSKTSLYRDLLLILLLFILRIDITGHYHGGNFHNFYKRCNCIEKKLVILYLKRLKHFILLGNNIKNDIKQLHLNLDNIRVVYNGIRPPLCRVERNQKQNRQECRILFIGHLSFAKGFYDLIMVYKKLFEKYSFISLNFAGQPIYSYQERNILVKDMPKEFNDTFLKSDILIEQYLNSCESYNSKYYGSVYGKIKEDLLINSDIFVLPSYSEGFSMAVLEAMNNSLPVITTNVGAMSEVVKDSYNGFIHPPGDQEKMFLQIEKMILDVPLRIKYGLNSYQLVRSKFDVNIQAVELAKIMLS